MQHKETKQKDSNFIKLVALLFLLIAINSLLNVRLSMINDDIIRLEQQIKAVREENLYLENIQK